MDFDYYGISEEIRDRLLHERETFIVDYWKDDRHFSRHKSKDKGSSSRIVDKNIYENIRNSLYRSDNLSEYQGVFNGYRQNDFIKIHLESKYILTVDFKNCYRNISYGQLSAVIEKRKKSLEKPLPMDLIKTMYFPYGYLQAGLSASNIMCDLVLKYSFDKEINRAIHRGGERLARYSRYYDDLYISSDDYELLHSIYATIKQIAGMISLPLNYHKSGLRKTDGVRILGSRISQGAVRIPRAEKNNLRAAIHELDATSRNDKTYEHRLRSVIYRLSRVCRTEDEPNEKYTDLLQYYRGELDELTQIDDYGLIEV